MSQEHKNKENENNKNQYTMNTATHLWKFPKRLKPSSK